MQIFTSDPFGLAVGSYYFEIQSSNPPLPKTVINHRKVTYFLHGISVAYELTPTQPQLCGENRCMYTYSHSNQQRELACMNHVTCNIYQKFRSRRVSRRRLSKVIYYIDIHFLPQTPPPPPQKPHACKQKNVSGIPQEVIYIKKITDF